MNYKKKYQDLLNFLEEIDDKKLYEFINIHGIETLEIIDQQFSQTRSLFCWFIGAVIGQKISFIKARSIRKKLYELEGTTNLSSDLLYKNQEYWTNLGLEPFQINIITNIKEKFDKKEIKFNSYSDIDNWITVHGIGQWTIKNAKIMYSLEHFKSFPMIFLDNDLVVKKNLKKIYQLKKINKSFIDQKIKEWDKYIGIINWYLWRNL